MMWGGRRGGFGGWGGYGRGMGWGRPWMMRRRMMGGGWGGGWGLWPGLGGFGFGRSLGCCGCFPFFVLAMLGTLGLVTSAYRRAKR